LSGNVFANMLHGPDIISGRHIVWPYFIRVEIVDRDDTSPQLLDLGQELSLLDRDDVLGDRIADPVDAMIAANEAAPDGAIDCRARPGLSQSYRASARAT
jgi:hypothetical protein